LKNIQLGQQQTKININKPKIGTTTTTTKNEILDKKPNLRKKIVISDFSCWIPQHRVPNSPQQFMAGDQEKTASDMGPL